jgi:hypothetical protein
MIGLRDISVVISPFNTVKVVSTNNVRFLIFVCPFHVNFVYETTPGEGLVRGGV